MYYSKTKNFDTTNGFGIGVSLFVSGCSFHCPGCFNSETWSFKAGRPYTEQTEKFLFKLLDNPHIDHFSVLGGEPMHPYNVTTVCQLLKRIHQKYPQKKIWIWTGYNNIDELKSDKSENQKQLIEETLKLCDYITFGRFEIDKRNIKRRYSGSDNQYTIDLKNNTILEDKTHD